MARLRLKVGNNELEIESSVKEINKQLEQIEILYSMLLQEDLKQFHNIVTKEEISPTKENESTRDQKPEKLTINDILGIDFGEWIKKLKIKTDDVVLFLIAAFYIQKRTQDWVFTEQEVIELFERNGVEFKHVNKIMQKNTKTGWFSEVTKEGGKTMYRLSDFSEENAIELIIAMFN
ncbi:hypothetical protein [Brevibacillus brevis]|uniref:hypothetical protein n=1 Tax=Brevibacillus brevis TaxID=1393 RepID=UPI00165E8C41|nr:hypothetical protein [Brevibacillus brevis]